MKEGYETGKRRRAARKIMTSYFVIWQLSLQENKTWSRPKGYYLCIESMWEGLSLMVIYTCI